MKRNDIRIMKMDRNNRSILMRALYADFCANREAGRPNEHYAALIIKVHNTPPGKLPLNGAEFVWPETRSTTCAMRASLRADTLMQPMQPCSSW